MGYRQANRKTLAGTEHPDRNAQFEHLDRAVTNSPVGEPVISVDTKKKELVGPFKNGGRELRPKGAPEQVLVHDFLIPDLGRVSPYGVYVRTRPGSVWGRTTIRLLLPSRASGVGGAAWGSRSTRAHSAA